jgi:hypothetical protein
MLAACEMKVGKDDKAKDAEESAVTVSAGGNVSVTPGEQKGLSVSVPGFSAKLDIPGIKIGSDHMDIDGMKLYPGTEVKGVNVVGKDGPGGKVMMGFSAPAAPAEVARYYADAARANGFSDVAMKDTTVTATKSDGDKMTISVSPSGTGSAGEILIVESK